MPNDIPYKLQKHKWTPTSRGGYVARNDQLATGRYQALSVQRRHAITDSMKCCGLTPLQDSISFQGKKIATAIPGVSLSISDKGARFCGVTRCCSPYCVDCVSYAKGPRIKRIAKGVNECWPSSTWPQDHTEEPTQPTIKEPYFLTLTIQRSANPEEQVKALQFGWKALQGRIAYRLKKLGIKSEFVRSLDITFRPDQHDVYHCHLHVIFILQSPFTPIIKKGQVIFERFEDLVIWSWADVHSKHETVVNQVSQRVEMITADKGISRYLVKFEGLGHEMANCQGKKGKKQTANPIDKYSLGWWELVGEVYREDQANTPTEERIFLPVYKRYLMAVKGKRTISFSRGWVKWEEPQPEEEPDVVDIPVPLAWFTLIKKHNSDLFQLAAFRCFICGDILILYDLLDQVPRHELIRWFINRYAPP